MTKITIIIFCTIFVFSCKTLSPVTPSQIDGLPVIDASEDDSRVVIKLYENQELPFGKGFSVFIEGWKAHDNISVEAISAQNKKINLLVGNSKLPVSENGKVEFSITYAHKKLSTGLWMLVVTGESEKHGHYFNVPKL